MNGIISLYNLRSNTKSIPHICKLRLYAQYLPPSRIIPAPKQLGEEAQAADLSPLSPDFG
jgi:hypothetical protein